MSFLLKLKFKLEQAKSSTDKEYFFEIIQVFFDEISEQTQSFRKPEVHLFQQEQGSQ